jgi:regulation of enolase protein 1 (concanavalin A-like superfamily)
MNPSRRLVLAILLAILVTVGADGQEKKLQVIEGWGTVTDPLGDCSARLEERKLIVTVPGGTHDLNQIVGGMNAPRILQSVEGDFEVEVKVTSDFDPGRKSASFNTVPFNSAGLLVWDGERNYIRLERNQWWAEEGAQYACYPPLIEYYRNGVFQETNPDPIWNNFFQGKSTWLRLERKGDRVTASYSHDGDKWTQARQFKANLATQLRVGLVVVNTSTKELKVEFDDFKVVTK